MPSISDVYIRLAVRGDVVMDQIFPSITNSGSPGEIDVRKLSTGQNNISPPTGLTGYTITGLFIIPPVDNTYTFALKGSPSDVGVAMHPTNPSYLGINPITPQGITIDLTGPNNAVFKFIWV